MQSLRQHLVNPIHHRPGLLEHWLLTPTCMDNSSKSTLCLTTSTVSKAPIISLNWDSSDTFTCLVIRASSV